MSKQHECYDMLKRCTVLFLEIKNAGQAASQVWHAMGDEGFVFINF